MNHSELITKLSQKTYLVIYEHELSSYDVTRELPGVALVNISTWPIFMGKGNTLFREICITLPGRVRRIERHRLSGYQSLGLRKHLDEPQTKDSHIS